MEHLLCAGVFGSAFQGPWEVGVISSVSEDKTETQEMGGRSRVTQQPRGRAGIQARPGWLHIQLATAVICQDGFHHRWHSGGPSHPWVGEPRVSEPGDLILPMSVCTLESLL